MATTEPLHRAYLLHARPYRESSLLLDLLSDTHGRVAAVARVGGKSGGAKKAQLQPFRPLMIALSGRTSLRNLAQLEAPTLPLPLSGQRLYAGLYLNELCQRLLQEWQPLDGLFDHYHDALMGLAESGPMEPLLREFERALLDLLGVLPPPGEDADGEPLHPMARYAWRPHQGWVLRGDAASGYSGDSLLQWQQQRLETPQAMNEIKRAVRELFRPLLGEKPLHSRTLFLQQRGRNEHSSGR
ncbi:DNA repair protein RecO [Ferrimonas balearica]|uniref:DNA repair protein RecO n=1 Tax=Ferrimonas balearica TaxID=44012 RepID=UPI001C9987E2|nr:DNA repair protein RecO [Ferrimonas balearica]MBY5922862.1 DNA repair protein RecO [Ferrimonas balearica]MBY5997761.1 DNA repair protein RecO [Ferrimonas balearica]